MIILFLLLYLPFQTVVMKVVLLVVGKSEDARWNNALADYQERLRHYLPFEMVTLPDIKRTGKMTDSQQKELEGQRICKFIQPDDWCVLLDERGQEFTSVQFAAYIEKKLHLTAKRLIFIVGGSFGFSDAVYAKATERIALSKMTFSHQMVRPIFVEQLYRAMTILRGEAYHHS